MLAIDGSNHVSGSNSLTLTTSHANDFVGLFLTRNAGTVTSVTDNSGVTAAWQLRATIGGTNSISFWWTTASAALSGATITVNYSANPGFQTIDAFGISGAKISSPFDSGSAVTGSADPLTISTTNAVTMVLGGFREVTASSPTAGSGFTAISGADFQLSEYQIFSSPQTNLSVTQSPSGGSNGCIADAIVAAAAAPSAVFRRTLSPIGTRSGSRQVHDRWRRPHRGGLLLRDPIVLPEAA